MGKESLQRTVMAVESSMTHEAVADAMRLQRTRLEEPETAPMADDGHAAAEATVTTAPEAESAQAEGAFVELRKRDLRSVALGGYGRIRQARKSLRSTPTGSARTA